MLKKIIAGIAAVLALISLFVSVVLTVSYKDSYIEDENIFSYRFSKQAEAIKDDFHYISETTEDLKYLYRTVDISYKNEIKSSDKQLQTMQEKYNNIQDIIDTLSSEQLSYLGINKDDGMDAINNVIEDLTEWKTDQDEFFEGFPSDGSSLSALSLNFQETLNANTLYIVSKSQEIMDLYWIEEKLDSKITEIEDNLAILASKSEYKTGIIISSIVFAAFTAIFTVAIVLIVAEKKKAVKKNISDINQITS